MPRFDAREGHEVSIERAIINVKLRWDLTRISGRTQRLAASFGLPRRVPQELDRELRLMRPSAGFAIPPQASTPAMLY